MEFRIGHLYNIKTDRKNIIERELGNMQYCNIRNSEKFIVEMIIHDEPLDDDLVQKYINYINKIQMSDSYLFDKHSKIINSLSDENFNKYIKFLSNATHKDH